jgi:WD40 repeat protein
MIKLWRWSDHAADLINIQGHTGVCGALLFSHDGTRLYSGGLQGYLKSWDLGTLQQVSSLRHGTEVAAIALSPDGKTLATGTKGQFSQGWVRLWRAPEMPFLTNDATVAQ